MHGLENYDRRHGWRGGWGHVDLVEGWEHQALRSSPPSERRGWRAAVITEASPTGARVRLAKGGGGGGLGEGGGEGALVGEDVKWANAGKGLHVGDLVFVEPSEKGGYNLRQTPAVNGALVAME